MSVHPDNAVDPTAAAPAAGASPAISVLLPVYNAGSYLAGALDSVLNQTFRDFEVIAVNDGSTDGSLAVLEGYARRDPRVRVISRPNTGIVGALNDAFAASRGALLARMDGDDECLPGRFAAQVRYMAENPDCVLLGTQVMVIDGRGRPVGPLKHVVFGHAAIDRALLQLQWPIIHPTVMIRRSTLAAVGGYRDGTFPNEDHDLFLRLAEVGRVENLPDVQLRYRRHATSVSWDSRSRRKIVEVVKAAHERRGIPFDAALAAEPEPPRGSERLARAKLHRSWAWQALAAGNVATARFYTLKALRGSPLTAENWKLAACVVRGR